MIGSGKTAALALQYLYEYPDVSVVACSRTYAHAKRLREQFPKTAVIPYEEWRRVIGDCDIERRVCSGKTDGIFRSGGAQKCRYRI